MEELNCFSVKYHNNSLQILDQTELPYKEQWVVIESVDHMVHCIKGLKVRGAPLIGVCAALALADYVSKQEPSKEAIQIALKQLREARPTAVNLMYAMDELGKDLTKEVIIEQAFKIAREDIDLCTQMAKNGLAVVKDDYNILTHCNTGALATAGVGTALGVISEAHKHRKNIHVYVDETRPLLQGGRLTTWELKQQNIPQTLICDNMAASLMAQNKVDLVLVGADRIARNGDFANKIGTYSLAIAAHFHKVPFYVVAPSTTIDAEAQTGADIPIELRIDKEVKGYKDCIWAPDVPTFNPAFDVTPAAIITGLITEQGIFGTSELAEQKHLN